MPAFTYTPIDGPEIDLGKYAPGLESRIDGRWGRHPIPGQQGDLKEDLGQNSLTTRVKLQFVGRTQNDYYTVIPAMAKSRRGVLLHPRRGSRHTVITSFREEIVYTERGDATIVDIDFEDEVLGQAAFNSGPSGPGPSARAQQVVQQSRAADTAATTLQAQVFLRPDLAVRAYAVAATAAVGGATTAARTYATAAQDSFSLGFYGPSVQAQLKALPPLVAASEAALRLVGSAADIQETVLSLETMLFAATQLDLAIQAAQPIPIKTTVKRVPGQSIYSFVQQHYGRSGKTPAEMRALVGLILRLNPQITRPSLIPDGTVVVRPV